MYALFSQMELMSGQLQSQLAALYTVSHKNGATLFSIITLAFKWYRKRKNRSGNVLRYLTEDDAKFLVAGGDCFSSSPVLRSCGLVDDTVNVSVCCFSESALRF